MAFQAAIQDQNRFPALIGHSGTAGTAETVRIVATSAGGLKVDDVIANSFTPSPYDNISLSYTSSILTEVKFKLGTSTISTLILGYDGSSNLTSVTMS